MDTRKTNLFTIINEKKMDELVKLLAEGIDLTWTNEKHETPLVAATQIRWSEGVKLMAKQPASANDNEMKSARYGSALHEAVYTEQVDLVEYLLKQNASLTWQHITNNEGLLHIAIRKKNKDIIKLLMKYKINLAWENKDKQTPIQLARTLAEKENNWEIVDLIAEQVCINANLNLNENDKGRFGDALASAVLRKFLKTAEYLLKAGASWTWEVDKQLCTHTAVINDDTDMLKLLLSHHPDLSKTNGDNKTPLVLALSLNKWKCAKLLFEASPNQVIDPKEGGVYLLNAVKDEQDALIKFLLQAGVVRSSRSENNLNNCLHLAVINNDLPALKLLLDTKINKRLYTKDCKTAVELACELDHWDCAQAIIEEDLQNKESLNQSYLIRVHYPESLSLAIKKGKYDIVKLLLDLNVPCTEEDDVIGNIAIYYACKINRKDILSLLLQKIDLKKVSTNKDNKTPFAIAKELNATECYALLNQNIFITPHKNADLIDSCETYLRYLEIKISITPFLKKQSLLGGWVIGNPPHIDSIIKDILTPIDYSNRKNLWASVIKIAALFKSQSTLDQHPTTVSFNIEQLNKITEIVELSEQQHTQKINQMMTNRYINTLPLYQPTLPPPTYEQFIATNQPLIPAPSSSFLTTNPVSQTVVKREQNSLLDNSVNSERLPNVAYTDLRFFSNNDRGLASSQSSEKNPFTPAPAGM